jgi:molybdate transport system substrate-binding protein
MQSAWATSLRLAAATNLRYVVPLITQAFTEQTGIDVKVTYAASGVLTTQIQHGAPYDLFLAAHPSYIESLQQTDHQYSVNTIAHGQMVLFISNDSKLVITNGIETIKQALHSNNLNKIAMANPMHAPYGQATKKILEEAGLWQTIQPYLLKAENASQATQYALTKGVDAGFIPYAHALQDKVKSQGQFVIVPAELPQQLIVLTNSESANQLFDFFSQAQAQALLKSNGFSIDE